MPGSRWDTWPHEFTTNLNSERKQEKYRGMRGNVMKWPQLKIGSGLEIPHGELLGYHIFSEATDKVINVVTF